MLVYDITLYKQARVALESEREKSIVWMWIVSIIGWLIAVGIFFISYKAISSGVLNEVFKKPATSTPTQQTTSPASQLIQSGSIKLSTANQVASKPNLTDNERNQIIGLINGALDDFNAAVEKDPDNYQAWYYRGLAYRNLIGFAQNADTFAIESFDKAVSLNPTDYNSYLQRGGIYYQNKQYDKAIENFQKVTELKPELANGYYNLGVAYKQVGAKDSARKALEKALELLPKDAPTRYKAESELNSL
jgi:tetratricopeptide (TPR) repeat protein